MDVPKPQLSSMGKRQSSSSHRITEKRRRVMMNNCLANLLRLLPEHFRENESRRIYKTDIVEMATKYIRSLQNKIHSEEQRDASDQFKRGYQECFSEALQFLLDKKAFGGSDTPYVQFISHMELHYATQRNGDFNTKLQNFTNGNPQIDTSHYNIPSRNQKFTPTQNQSPKLKRGERSPGSNIMDHETSFSQQNSALISEVYGSIDVYNNNFMQAKERDGTIHNTRVFATKGDFTASQGTGNEGLYSSGTCTRNNGENSLRNIRKQDLVQRKSGFFSVVNDNLSYKFKNTLEERFTQDQSTDYRSSNDIFPHVDSINTNDTSPPRNTQSHVSNTLSYKRGKLGEHNTENSSDNADESSSGTNSSQNNASMNIFGFKDSFNSEVLFKGKLNTNESDNKKYEGKCSLPGKVPIFALHAKGSFYVPASVDYASLVPLLGHHDLLDFPTSRPNTYFHTVTINVNVQPIKL